MVTPSPRTAPAFKVTVYDKTFRRLGWVGGYTSLTVTVRHNAVGTAELVVPLDHPRVPDLMTAGARVVIEYDGQPLMSGRVMSRTGEGPSQVGTLTVSVTSDFAVLSQILGWPNPTGSTAQQGAASSYYSVTGPAETVVKQFVRVNAARLGLPITTAPDLGRGSTVTVQMRMHPLADRLFPAVDLAGVGVTVLQGVSGLVVDCYTPTVRSRVLSEASGVLVGWSWSLTDDVVSRVVVGGQGVGTARAFISVVNAASETASGTVMEGFVDARDVDTGVLMTQRGNEALAAGGPSYGFGLTLAETTTFKYGRTLSVGDRVTVAVAPGVPVVDVCREVTLSDTTDGGVEVVPTVGSGDSSTLDDPNKVIVSAVNRIGKKLRDLGSI